MFFVINKEKIYAYIVSILTIITLFVLPIAMKNKENTRETSSNIEIHEEENYENNSTINLNSK